MNIIDIVIELKNVSNIYIQYIFKIYRGLVSKDNSIYSTTIYINLIAIYNQYILDIDIGSINLYSSINYRHTNSNN